MAPTTGGRRRALGDAIDAAPGPSYRCPMTSERDDLLGNDVPSKRRASNPVPSSPVPPSDLPMTERRSRILALVVREHVRRALPVASGALVRHHELDCSAATVRSEMAALEEMGLLSQPHTSAGRVPTVAGYRFFVERLMHNAGLPEHHKRTIRHQFHQAGWDPERWMRLSAAVVARSCGAAGLVAAPRGGSVAIRRLELVDMGSGNVQVVALLDDGLVHQARWRPAHAYTQAALDQIAHALNEDRVWGPPEGATTPTRAGGPFSDASTPARPLSLAAEAKAAVDELAGRASQPAAPRLYHAGLSQILVAPELADGDRLREVVALLEHGRGLESILGGLPPGGVHVFIGGEPPLERVPYLTLVLSRFGRARTPAGVLGVVGPTRIAYERAVPTVGFVADLMTRMLAGDPEPEAA